ncbi:MAG: MCE family protein [Chitinophagaceae bacterium]|nr:MCE family protein [Chitinophagaceae bacterium]
MKKESGFTWKLGMFVIIGLVLFIGTIYFVGKQKNLFGNTFHLKAQFKTVSGLKEGNNVRFSGINIGTVHGIELITDTSVLVDLVIKKDVQKFIKKDAVASIGSDGLMGDKVLTITPGNGNAETVGNNALIASKNAVEMADIMNSLKTSVDNAGIITGQLAEVSYKINNGNGALSKLISDDGFSNSLKGTLTNLQTSTDQFARFTTNLNDGALSSKLDSTMSNLQSGTKGLSDNMDAVKNSFLLRGYFKKQKEAEAKKRLTKSRQKKNALKNKTEDKR